MERRRVLGWAASSIGSTVLGSLAPKGFAAAGFVTPSQMRGPFYPQTFPLDKDFDLTKVIGRDGVAFGEIITVSGRVADVDGLALEGVMIEIWQVNGFGRYHHEGDDSNNPIDPNFQGYGAVMTNAHGTYSFRTIQPIAYPGRAPHIHFSVSPKKGPSLVTQMYLAGARENAGDFLLSGIRDKTARESLIVAFEKKGNELSGTFDIILPKPT